MNEILKTIYNRRAVRKYKDVPVDKDLIEQVIAAGRMAPSAMNRQPWHFYVLTNRNDINVFSKAIKTGAIKGLFREGIKQLLHTAVAALHFPKGADFTKEEDMIFHGAPVVIFITSSKDNEWALLDVGMCAQNMMLTAKSLGLDTCPVGMAKYVMFTKEYSRLNVPKGEGVDLAVVLGYGDEDPEVHARITTNITYVG